MDFLLGLGSSLDWVSPIFYFIKDAVYSPADFGIDAYAGWDEFNIKKLLNHFEIKSWGYMYDLLGNVLIFTVPKQDADSVYRIFCAAGVPMIYVPDEVNFYA